MHLHIDPSCRHVHPAYAVVLLSPTVDSITRPRPQTKSTETLSSTTNGQYRLLQSERPNSPALSPSRECIYFTPCACCCRTQYYNTTVKASVGVTSDGGNIKAFSSREGSHEINVWTPAWYQWTGHGYSFRGRWTLVYLRRNYSHFGYLF